MARAPIGGPERADKMSAHGNKDLNWFFRGITPNERRVLRRAYRTFRRYETRANARMDTIMLAVPGQPIAR